MMAQITKTSAAIFQLALTVVAMFAWGNAQSSSLGENNSSIEVVNSIDDIHFTLQSPSIDRLTIYALPVGQGDCTLIQCPNGNLIVLDCGSSGRRQHRLTPTQIQTYLNPMIRQGKVKAIIITHADWDHFSYLPQIQWNLESIQAVIIGGTLQDYTRFNPQRTDIHNWLRNFQNRQTLFTVNNGERCIGECPMQIGLAFCQNPNIRLDILAANVHNQPNEKSIVMTVSVNNGWSALLPGDMEGPAATQIANAIGPQLQSTVYKMAHHGASTRANQPDWLERIRPRIAFASSAYNFGNCRHPRCETIGRLVTLNTIPQGVQPHPFYCGNRNVPPSTSNQFMMSMYVTNPTPNVLCLLKYSSMGDSGSNCWLVQQLPIEEAGEDKPSSDDDDDDECPSDGEEDECLSEREDGLFMNGKGSANMAGNLRGVI